MIAGGVGGVGVGDGGPVVGCFHELSLVLLSDFDGRTSLLPNGLNSFSVFLSLGR